MRHLMTPSEIRDALKCTPTLIENHGIQFQDGHRLISIPPLFSAVIAEAVATTLRCMEQNLSEMTPGVWSKKPAVVVHQAISDSQHANMPTCQQKS